MQKLKQLSWLGFLYHLKMIPHVCITILRSVGESPLAFTDSHLNITSNKEENVDLSETHTAVDSFLKLPYSAQTNTPRCAYGISALSLSMKNFRAQSDYLSLSLSLHGANS